MTTPVRHFGTTAAPLTRAGSAFALAAAIVVALWIGGLFASAEAADWLNLVLRRLHLKLAGR